MTVADTIVLLVIFAVYAITLIAAIFGVIFILGQNHERNSKSKKPSVSRTVRNRKSDDSGNGGV
jgi:flagellar basal body-associated protein FliL